MMPHVDGMASYKDKLLMYDNIDTPLSESYTPEIKAFLHMLPMKINFAVAILCLEGKVEIKCNLADYSVTKNGLVVIPGGSKAEKVDIADDSKLIAIAVPDSTYTPEDGSHDSVYNNSNFTSPISIELEDAEVTGGVGAYKLLKALLNGNKTMITDDLVKAYMNVLAGIASVGFKRATQRHRKAKLSSQEQIYKNFLTNMSENYRMHRDVSFYAEMEDLTPKYFAKAIYEASGRRPLDLIKEQVIIDAKALLKKGTPIQEVCNILNFSSQSQFSTYFKGATGKTPGDFLRKK